jgi:hypothetical protein
VSCVKGEERPQEVNTCRSSLASTDPACAPSYSVIFHQGTIRSVDFQSDFEDMLLYLKVVPEIIMVLVCLYTGVIVFTATVARETYTLVMYKVNEGVL